MLGLGEGETYKRSVVKEIRGEKNVSKVISDGKTEGGRTSRGKTVRQMGYAAPLLHAERDGLSQSELISRLLWPGRGWRGQIATERRFLGGRAVHVYVVYC